MNWIFPYILLKPSLSLCLRIKQVPENYHNRRSDANRDWYLEVTVDGNLVHSKDNGDGYVDSAEKMEKILDAVEKGSR